MAEKLQIVIDVDGKNATTTLKDVDGATKKVDSSAKKATKSNKEFEGSFSSLAVGAAATSAAFALLNGKVVAVGAEFENFQVRLQHTLGSVEEGNRLFEDMTKFAGQVPFAFNDIMDAATNMSGVMTGGVDEVNKWMPMIADLAAVSGLSIQQTTEQVVRMYSAGAGAADLFRERGITAMLGFQSGVSVTAEETRKQLIEAYQDPASKFADAANDLAKTWDGSLSMMGDKWTLFFKGISDKGVLDANKGVLGVMLDELNSNKKGVDDLSSSIADSLVTSMQVAIVATGELAKGFAGLTVIDDILRLGVDKTSGVIVDAFKAELEGISGLLMMIRDVTGQDLGVASVEATLSSMNALRKGISETQKESTTALDVAVLSANDSITKIDELSSKLFTATELSRKSQSEKNQIDNPTSTAKGLSLSEIAANELAAQQEKDAALLLAAQEAAAKIIDVNSLKFEQIRIMSAAAFGTESEQIIAKSDADILAIEEERQRYLDATELQIEDKTAREEALAEVDAYYNQLIVDRANETNSQLDSSDAKRSKDAVKWEKMTGEQKLATAQQGLASLSGMMDSHSRKAFEVGKAAATANAVIDTYRAATGAYASLSSIPYVGPVLGAAAAAAAVVAGVANVQKIQSSTFGGGGAAPSVPSAVTAPSGGSVPAASAPAPAQEIAPVTNVQVSIESGIYDQNAVRDLIDVINVQIGDGVNLNTGGV